MTRKFMLSALSLATAGLLVTACGNKAKPAADDKMAPAMSDKTSGDKMQGDKMQGDKMQGDKMQGDKKM